MSARRAYRGFRYAWSRVREGEKIEWFISSRLHPWLLRPVEVEMRGKNYYAALYLMLLASEILSGFWAGKGADAGTFSAFVAHYFDALLTTRAPNPLYRCALAAGGLGGKREISFAEMLWAVFRRGFENACTSYPGFSLTVRSRYYCRFYRRVGLRMDIAAFHRDFIRASESYISEVYSDYLLRRRFLKRFDQVFKAFKIPRLA